MGFSEWLKEQAKRNREAQGLNSDPNYAGVPVDTSVGDAYGYDYDRNNQNYNNASYNNSDNNPNNDSSRLGNNTANGEDIDISPTYTFNELDPTGQEQDSLIADIQKKYGGIASESGRRGSQAKELLYQEGDALLQGFVGSDFYNQLKEDPTAITNTDLQKALSDAGIDWEAFSYGKENTSTGNRTYSKIDFEMLDKYIQQRLHPMQGSGSLASDVYGKGTFTNTNNTNTTNPNVGSDNKIPTVDLDPNFDNPLFDPNEMKRI